MADDAPAADFVIALTEHPGAAELAGLGDALAAFNASEVGPSGRRALALFARDGAGETVAALSGYTAWGWLFVQWLVVSETARGRGLAGTLLATAEAEARARGCHGAWIDTFSPTDLRVYERAGYAPFGTLEDFPIGRARTFLQKRL